MLSTNICISGVCAVLLGPTVWSEFWKKLRAQSNNRMVYAAFIVSKWRRV